MANRLKEVFTALGATYTEEGILLDFYIASYLNAKGIEMPDQKILITELPNINTDWNTLMAAWRLIRKRLSSANPTNVHEIIDGFMTGDIKIAFEAVSNLCKQLNN